MTTEISANGPKRAVIVTAVIIILIIIAVAIVMFVISATAEPVEADCGLANDLTDTRTCQPTNSN